MRRLRLSTFNAENLFASLLATLPPMARPNTDARIQTLVETFVNELTALVREAALASVQDALSTGSSPRPTRTGTQPARRRYRKRTNRPGGRPNRAVKRTASDLEALQTTLLRFIQQNPGQRMENIAPALKMASRDLLLPVRKLLADKAIKTKGSTRTTTYFPK